MLIYLAPNNHSLRVPWKINPFKGTEHEMKPKMYSKSESLLRDWEFCRGPAALPRTHSLESGLRHCSTCASAPPALFHTFFALII